MYVLDYPGILHISKPVFCDYPFFYYSIMYMPTVGAVYPVAAIQRHIQSEIKMFMTAT